MTADKPQVCEIFCGAGGMALGFEPFFEITQAIDILPEAVRTYSANHQGTEVMQRDVRTVTGSRKDCDGLTGIIGGPPCQCWSLMNVNRDPNDPRAELAGEFMRLVDEIRPEFFVLENVPYTPKPEKQKVITQGKELGYQVASLHLNSAEYGAAQTRRRWVVIGSRSRKIDSIPASPAKTVGQVLGGLGTNWGLMRSSEAVLQRLQQTRINEWIALSGGGFKNAIKLQWDQPSPAVVNLKKVYMVHPRENRNISLAEAAALQGFPGDYRWTGTETVIAQMIANAMPAELAGSIAGALARS